MPTTTRKAVISAFGSLSNLDIVHTTIPDPESRFVQVGTIYTGFSGADVNMRLGRYPFQKKAPLTPGYCLVGKVVRNGPGCSQFRQGDVVAALTVYDAEADLVNVEEKYLVPVPQGTDLQQATAIVVDWYTAYSMVVKTAKVTAGQKVFVHGMSGAVGHAIMVLSLRQGAKVYGCCSEKNFVAVRAVGGTPFSYANKGWMKAMLDIGGADVVCDALGFESWDESYSILSQTGHLFGYGTNLATLTDQEPSSTLWPLLKLLGRNLILWSGKKTTFFYITRDDIGFKENLVTLMDSCRKGEITVPIKAVYELEDVRKAHEDWGKIQGVGSFLIKVSDP